MNSRIEVIDVRQHEIGDPGGILVTIDVWAGGGRAPMEFVVRDQGDRKQNAQLALRDLERFAQETLDALHHGRVQDRNAGPP